MVLMVIFDVHPNHFHKIKWINHELTGLRRVMICPECNEDDQNEHYSFADTDSVCSKLFNKRFGWLSIAKLGPHFGALQPKYEEELQ